jgi:hypothetical protein
MAQVQKLSITHDEIMDWCILHPGATLAEMGMYFGYSVSWLSQIVNSDLFQARYKERRGEIDAAVAADLPTRLRANAALALEKLGRHLETSEDPEFLMQIADKSLHRLGYGPNKGALSVNTGNVTINQQNNFMVNKDQLAEARAKMGLVTQISAVEELLPPPEVVIEAEGVELQRA